jgi:hypothetical protein
MSNLQCGFLGQRTAREASLEGSLSRMNVRIDGSSLSKEATRMRNVSSMSKLSAHCTKVVFHRYGVRIPGSVRMRTAPMARCFGNRRTETVAQLTPVLFEAFLRLDLS